ncbi:MAG: TIGR03960 family B12-binding radical SAM protein [Oscillospiraceae bacterium]|nr:TIGR03960 family B12-binding radical SAM protein [Oscillospiraceae bacterium]
MSLFEKIEPLLLQVQKPARYIGGEMGSVMKDKSQLKARFAFCFPDRYDVGMSNLGMKILYTCINNRPEYWCERVFAPDTDFEALMRANGLPLYALESLEPIKDFDFIGFTLGYELCYTNILNMLDLAGVPVWQKDRGEAIAPIVCAGGSCACNPEPIADFIDLFFMGEGEELDLEVMDLYVRMRDAGASRTEFLRAAAQIEGVYVPSLYEVTYNGDGTVRAVTPEPGIPSVVRKRIIDDMDKAEVPEDFVVPFSEIVHDRAVTEVLRGCIRGCRFCQAGFLYRPFREKTPEVICRQARTLIENTGYDELSLCSLSTSDHSRIEEMMDGLLTFTEDAHINLSLPSLRVDNFSTGLMNRLRRVRSSGLTFAPEAGTQRLRDVINKNVTEEELMRTCKIAFDAGQTSVKLYFMMGLPTETDDDIRGIIELAQRVVDMFYESERRPKGRPVQISCSVATFVPKPFTPFEFHPQDTREMIAHKQKILEEAVSGHKRIRASWHFPDSSILEAVLARGDRRLCAVIYGAWQRGCVFDAWSEHFRYDLWLEAFSAAGLNVEFYANRARSYDEVFPWDHIDYYVEKSFLIKENEKAKQAQVTPHCRAKCAGCGVTKITHRPCF